MNATYALCEHNVLIAAISFDLFHLIWPSVSLFGSVL